DEAGGGLVAVCWAACGGGALRQAGVVGGPGPRRRTVGAAWCGGGGVPASLASSGPRHRQVAIPIGLARDVVWASTAARIGDGSHRGVRGGREPGWLGRSHRCGCARASRRAAAGGVGPAAVLRRHPCSAGGGTGTAESR